MTLSRFETIRKNLHFSNNWTTLGNDRSNKIDPVLKHFNEHFQDAITPSKAHSIDERIVKFKEQNIMKQYIKNKPIKWVRASSKTGYVYESHLYAGRKPECPEESQFCVGETVIL